MADRRELQQAGIYHIRLTGSLDDKWADWFEGFVMATRGSGQTLLSGAVADQAALEGVLGRIHSLGLPLLLLAQTGCPCPSKRCPRHGQCSECAAHYSTTRKLPFCFRERTRWDRQWTALTKAE